MCPAAGTQFLNSSLQTRYQSAVYRKRVLQAQNSKPLFRTERNTKPFLNERTSRTHRRLSGRARSDWRQLPAPHTGHCQGSAVPAPAPRAVTASLNLSPPERDGPGSPAPRLPCPGTAAAQAELSSARAAPAPGAPVGGREVLSSRAKLHSGRREVFSSPAELRRCSPASPSSSVSAHTGGVLQPARSVPHSSCP